MFSNFKKLRDKRLETDFLSEALEIIEKPASPLGRFTIWITVLLLAVFAVWSVIGKMDEIAVAAAEITPKDGLKVVQPVYEGIITDIFVAEGDFVTAGQELIKLDTTTDMIGIENITEKRNSLTFQNELLTLISSGSDISDYAEKNGITGTSDIQTAEMVSGMQKDYNAKKAQYESQIAQYSKQVEIENNSLDKLKTDLTLNINKKNDLSKLYGGETPENKALDNYLLRLETAEKELSEYKKLFESGAIAKYQLDEKQNEADDLVEQVELQDLRAEYETAQNSSEIDDIQSRIDLLRQDISAQENVVEKQEESLLQAQKSIDSLEIEYQQSISNMLVSNNTALLDLDSDYQIKKEIQNSQILTAPVDGYIQAMAVNTIGGVVTPAQPVLSIVPENAELIVEAKALNKDIGFIFTGQDVSVKLDAFSFNKYGKLSGKVIHISPSANEDERMGLVYKVKIAVDKDYFNIDGQDVPISSGMTGTAEIKLDERRIIEFLLEPVFEYFDNSLEVK